jgi:protoheme ferro-lyase
VVLLGRLSVVVVAVVLIVGAVVVCFLADHLEVLVELTSTWLPSSSRTSTL